MSFSGGCTFLGDICVCGADRPEVGRWDCIARRGLAVTGSAGSAWAEDAGQASLRALLLVPLREMDLDAVSE